MKPHKDRAVCWTAEEAEILRKAVKAFLRGPKTERKQRAEMNRKPPSKPRIALLEGLIRKLPKVEP